MPSQFGSDPNSSAGGRDTHLAEVGSGSSDRLEAASGQSSESPSRVQSGRAAESSLPAAARESGVIEELDVILNSGDLGEIAVFWFREATDAAYLLDLVSGRFIAVNPSFCRLTGYTESELLSGVVRHDDLLVPEQRQSDTSYRRREATSGDEERAERLFNVEVRTKPGAVRSCEVSIRKAVFRGRLVTLGAARDQTSVKRQQEALTHEITRQRDEAQAQRQKTQLASMATVRVAQILERVTKIPRFTQLLESSHELTEMLDRAADYLATSIGMEFAAAAVYLWNESRTELELRSHRVEAGPPCAKSLEADETAHPLMMVANGQRQFVELPQRNRLSVPIKAENQVLGVLKVGLHDATRKLLEADPTWKKLLYETITTLGDLIGLRIDNLRLLEQVRLQTIVDQLTGVYNRRYFDAKLEEEVRRTTRYNRDLSLIIMDMDRFKTINDTLGHQQGDLLLQEFGKLLREQVRSVDIVCRMGGDEFAVIFPETNTENARRKAEDLRAKVASTEFSSVLANGPGLRITTSIGLSFCTSTMTAADLYRHADEALYTSKAQGRNRVTLYDPANVAKPKIER